MREVVIFVSKFQGRRRERRVACRIIEDRVRAP